MESQVRTTYRRVSFVSSKPRKGQEWEHRSSLFFVFDNKEVNQDVCFYSCV